MGLKPDSAVTVIVQTAGSATVVRRVKVVKNARAVRNVKQVTREEE